MPENVVNVVIRILIGPLWYCVVRGPLVTGLI